MALGSRGRGEYVVGTNVEAANFFFDAIFTRSTGSQFRTPFHQDEPYWSVEGFDTCSAWMPLVPVAKRSALEFVKGSHAWDVRYAQTNFGALTGDERDQVVYDQLEGKLEPKQHPLGSLFSQILSPCLIQLFRCCCTFWGYRSGSQFLPLLLPVLLSDSALCNRRS